MLARGVHALRGDFPGIHSMAIRAAELGILPAQAMVDAGYRSEAALEKLAGSPCEVIVALGREGKEAATIDAERYAFTAAMAARLQTEAGKTAYRRRKATVWGPQRLDQDRVGLPTIQPAGN